MEHLGTGSAEKVGTLRESMSRVCRGPTSPLEVLPNSIEPYSCAPATGWRRGHRSKRRVPYSFSNFVDDISAIAVGSGRSMAYIGP
jgi:hypothetical protein